MMMMRKKNKQKVQEVIDILDPALTILSVFYSGQPFVRVASNPKAGECVINNNTIILSEADFYQSITVAFDGDGQILVKKTENNG